MPFELQAASSFAILNELLTSRGDDASAKQVSLLRAGSGLGIVEGWRGSIVTRVEVDGGGFADALQVR